MTMNPCVDDGSTRIALQAAVSVVSLVEKAGLCQALNVGRLSRDTVLLCAWDGRGREL